MQLVDKRIKLSELKGMSIRMFGNFVKAVVDIKKEVMVVDADMHADQEKFLLDNGSKQDDLWGINLYPDQNDDNLIEFDSIINVRPRLNNFTREVENEQIKEKIINIVNRLIKK